MRLQQPKISKHKDLFLRFSMAGVRGVPGEGGKAGSDLAAVFPNLQNFAAKCHKKPAGSRKVEYFC